MGDRQTTCSCGLCNGYARRIAELEETIRKLDNEIDREIGRSDAWQLRAQHAEARVAELEAENACLKIMGIEDMRPRIAELEAANERLQGDLLNWMTTADSAIKRAVAAEAKLARVREWAIANDDEDYIDILSDTRKPLAVVEGMEFEGGGDNHSDYSVTIQFDDMPCESAQNWLDCTVIVMPKGDDNG